MLSHPPKSPPSLLSSSPIFHQLTDCCVGTGRHGRVGRSPIVVVVLVAVDRGGCRRPAPLSTSVDPAGNDDPSSFPSWASSAPSSLVVPSSFDCCVVRLLRLFSPSTPSASSRHDLVAPSSIDCRISLLSVGCRVHGFPPSHLPPQPPPLHAMTLSRRRRLIVASCGFSPLISLHRLRLFTP